MIDMSNISRDFMPRRRRPEEEGFAPQAPGTTMPPPSGGMPVGGGGISTGQPQPFAPVAGQMGTAGPLQQGLPPGMTPGAGGMPGAGGEPQMTSLPHLPPGGDPMSVENQRLRTQAMAESQQMQQRMGGGVPTGGGMPGAPGGEAGGFPYPEQWQTATDIYGQLAGGMPGMPDPGAIWGGYQQQAGDLSRELAEQAGMGMGTRYGSALGRNIADVGMRAGERFGGEMERLRMGDVAGQRSAMLGAAGGLSGLGGAQAMLPGQLAGQAMGLGGQYQQMQNIPLQAEYQEFMRTQPEYSPYLPYMQQGAQVPYGPQTFQPGFSSNMMDIGSQVAMYNMMNPGGGQQSWLTRPW